MKIVAPELQIHTGHDIGFCKTGVNSDYIFIPIPKNASSHTELILKNQCDIVTQDNFILNQSLLSKKKIVVLREPYGRYISGLLEYLYQNRIKHDQVDFDDLFKTFVFDEHTLLQAQFLKDIDTDDCIFLKLGKTYSHDLSHLIQHKLHIDQKFPSKNFMVEYNRTIDAPKKVMMLNKLTEYLANNERVMLSLKEYLVPDYDLFSSVKFYNNR
jgi:hypothetical protein